MNRQSKGIVIALTAATLLVTSGVANAVPSNAQPAVGSVECLVTTSKCNSAAGCPTKMVITTKTVQECTDQGGKVQQLIKIYSAQGHAVGLVPAASSSHNPTVTPDSVVRVQFVGVGGRIPPWFVVMVM